MRRGRGPVVFVIPTLQSGGAEGVFLTLASEVAEVRACVLIAVTASGRLRERVPQHLTLVDLKSRSVSRAALPLLKTLRKLEPAAVFSTLGYLNMVLLMMKRLLPKGCRLIVREGSIPTVNLHDSPRTHLMKFLYRRLYPGADVLVCQSRAMQEDLVRNFSIPESVTRVIRNPFVPDFGMGGTGLTEEGIHLVHLGRLDRVKCCDELIDAFSRWCELEPALQLWFLGEGPERDALMRQSRRLRREDQIHFPGYVPNPAAWLREASLMVMSSKYEGLPNALIEALACNCPVLIRDHPGGTREIAELCGVADRIHLDIDDWNPDWLAPLRLGVAELVDQHFSMEKIRDQYLSLVDGPL